MGDYYNKTRTPLGVTLQRGGSMSVGSKSWCFIAPEDEGTPSLAELVRKGFLVRALVSKTDLSGPSTPAALSDAPVAAVPLPLVNVAPVVVKPEAPPEAPSVVEPKLRRNK